MEALLLLIDAGFVWLLARALVSYEKKRREDLGLFSYKQTSPAKSDKRAPRNA